MNEYNPNIITGDFNVNDIMSLMPNMKDNYIRTINDITTVKGDKQDDILIHRNIKYSSNILKLLSDHFMVISVVEL